MRSTIKFILIFVFSHCTPHLLTAGGLLKSDGTDSLQINKYLKSARQKFAHKDMSAAELAYKKAYALSKKLGNDRKLVETISELTRVLSAMGKYAEALKIGYESLSLSNNLKDTTLILDAYIRTGAQHFNQYQQKEAAARWLTGVKIAEKAKDSLRRLKLITNLSATFINLKDFKKARFYASEAYKMSLVVKDTVSIAKALVNFSTIEGEMGNFEMEARYMKKAVALGNSIKDYSYVINAYLNLGESAKIQKQFQRSLNYYKEAFNVAVKRKVHNFDIYLYIAMAEGLLNVNKNREALIYAKKGLSMAGAIGNPSILAMLYDITANVYENLKKPQQALEYFRKSVSIKDSITRTENETAVNRMELEYRTAKKEKEIADQKLIISKSRLELQQKNSYILSITLISAILLITAVSIYLVYSGKYKLIQKKKDVAILEAMISGEEKERSRLALNLHDGIGGILSAIKMQMSMLSNDFRGIESSDLFKKALSLLNTASSETRAIAHNLAPQVLFHQGLDAALSAFCQKANSAALEVIYYSIGEIGRFNTEFELFLYRAVQEGFSNIVKHASASKAIIQLSNTNGTLFLTVEDDGKGMDVMTLQDTGLGLSNLRSRTIAKGGTFELSSHQASGTTINIEFDTYLFLVNETIVPDDVARPYRFML
jgi:signal transduction histidine kinase